MAKGVAIGRLAIVLAICVVVSFALNFVIFLDEGKDDFWALLRSKSIPISEFVHVATTKDHDNSNDAGKHNNSVLSTRTDLQDRTININNNLLAGLSCLQHGGPSDEAAAEMVYWRDIPDDAEYTSPFYEEGKEKFLLWDMDAAGFNNKRISFENFLLLAHSMGRTLVMPPKGLWKLFDKDVSLLVLCLLPVAVVVFVVQSTQCERALLKCVPRFLSVSLFVERRSQV